MGGAGKSSLANKLVGTRAFKVGNGPKSTTVNNQEFTIDDVTIVDTPGFPDSDPKMTSKRYDSVVDSVTAGCTVLVWVIQHGRITQSEVQNHWLVDQFMEFP